MSFKKFPQREHLKSRKKIQMLFQSGEAFSVFPYRVIYHCAPATSVGIVKVGFSVPSRRFKKAVDRNRIKRMMREVYRLQKEELTVFTEKQALEVDIFFIYTGKKLPEYLFLQKKMEQSLNKLLKRMFKAI